jgi:GxxExxY protein
MAIALKARRKTANMEVQQQRDAVTTTQLSLKEMHNVVVESALEVHKNMGLGFDEEAYSKALAVEFDLRAIPYESQCEVTLDYKGKVAGTYTLQFVVDNRIVVVLLATDQLGEMDEAKVRRYLKASRLPVGIILDFGRTELEVHSVHRK